MSEPPASEPVPATYRPAFRADPSHWRVQEQGQASVESLLGRIPIFRDVPPHHLRELARLAHAEHFAAGQPIIRMGAVGSTMYVIRTGRVQVQRERPGAEPLVLAVLGPGEFFGELSIFDSEARSATVVALEDTEAVIVGRVDLVRLVTRSPDMALTLLKALGARLRVANDRLTTGPPQS